MRPLSSSKTSFLHLVISVILLFVLAACGDDSTPTPEPTAVPTVAAATATAPAAPPTEETSPATVDQSAADAPVSPLDQPESPLAVPLPRSSVRGQLISSISGKPISKDVVRLAEVYCPEGITQEEKETECFWGLDDAFSPTTFTDEDGNFFFKDVEARDYVLMVGDMMSIYALVVQGPKEKPIIWSAPPNGVLDTGVNQVNYE